MTKLELVNAVNQAAIEMRAAAEPYRTHLKCPGCAFEFMLPSAMAPDRRITCKRCKTPSELRLMHEAWCASRRTELKRACPEIRWPDADRPVDRDGRSTHRAADGASVFAVS
jgi:hypothetical protein